MLWYSVTMVQAAKRKTTSILFDDASDLILKERDPEPDAGPSKGNRSVIIREVLRRYDQICRKELPPLSPEEKKLLREAGRKGGAPKPTSFTTLMDVLRRLGAAGEQLERRILGFPAVQQIAVLDDVERHWAGKSQDDAGRAAEDRVPKRRRQA
jgi:hypothetical protein